MLVEHPENDDELISEIYKVGRGEKLTLEEAKNLLKIPELWKIYKLPGDPSKNPCCSPFREDKHPSFSIYDEGRRCKDLATGWNADAADVVGVCEGITDPREKVCRFIQLAEERHHPILFPSNQTTNALGWI